MTRARDIADLAGGGTLLTRQLFTATAGQTTFTPSAGYNPGALEVFMNGLMLLASDYTATNSSTVVLGVAANAGDEVEILTYQINTIGDTVSASNGGTFNDNITVNKNGSDGSIVSFNRGGITVGSVGINSVGLYIDGEAEHAGIRFGSAAVVPRDNGADSNAGVDLGDGSTRFKDAYLSGGVYLGGTTSANKLHDYEEGTLDWVVRKSDGSAGTLNYRVVRYTKVGRVVHISGHMRYDSNTGSGAGTFVIDGTLPFTPATRGGLSVTHIRSTDYTSTAMPPISISYMNGSTTVYVNRHGNGYDANVNNVGANAQTNIVIAFQGTYHTST